MEDERTLIPAEDILPVIKQQSIEIENLKQALNDLKNENLTQKEMMPLDFRKLESFRILQQAYFDIFATNEVSLEFVPFEIIQKADKWALKMFNKDLNNQVNKNYKNLIKQEKREQKEKEKFNKKSKSEKKRFNLFRFFVNLFKKKNKK